MVVSRFYPAFFIAFLGLTGLGATCSTRPTEITRERAIAIAQVHVSFDAASVDTEKVTEEGRRVWRVTFRGRLPGQPPGLFETAVIEIDRQSGEVVSIART